jgi:hypothetical protein
VVSLISSFIVRFGKKGEGREGREGIEGEVSNLISIISHTYFMSHTYILYLSITYYICRIDVQ